MSCSDKCHFRTECPQNPTYAMLEKPYLFSGYVALSAPYSIEQEYFDRRLAEIENTRTLSGARVYFGVGNLDFNKRTSQKICIFA